MEKEVLTALFHRYSNDVFRLAYSYLGNRPDAEDVCQTVFLKLAESNTVLLPGTEKSWLLTCAANASKNLTTSYWRRNVGELDPTISFPDPKDRELHDVVMSLPPKYRIVIHLYYFEGYDQREIADILRITRTNVQTRMNRARNLLKKELKDYEG